MAASPSYSDMLAHAPDLDELETIHERCNVGLQMLDIAGKARQEGSVRKEISNSLL